MSSFLVFVGGGANTHQVVHRATLSLLVMHSHQPFQNLGHSAKHHTRWWVHVCKTRLLHQECLAHARSCARWVWIPCDAGQALRPACMEVAPTPSGRLPAQVWYDGHSAWVLHPSSRVLQDQWSLRTVWSHRTHVSASSQNLCSKLWVVFCAHAQSKLWEREFNRWFVLCAICWLLPAEDLVEADGHKKRSGCYYVARLVRSFSLLKESFQVLQDSV